MKVCLLWSVFFFFCLNAFAQKEGNIWVFGTNAGLDFNSGIPVPVRTGVAGFEGCASVCDAAGQLLFYTEGRNVWDRNHNLMPNGTDLMPGVSSTGIPDGYVSGTQQALIVPMPGDPDKYYVFSLEQEYLPGGIVLQGNLWYSVVDMAANGGLGTVSAGQKSVLINMGLTEKMAAAAGTDCNVWVVAMAKSSNEFRAFEVNTGGVQSVPVSSFAGTLNSSRGTLKVSPNGRRLAAAHTSRGVEVYDFNPATGQVSNAQTVTTGSHYAVVFSPDGSKLYASNYSHVYQFDLSTSLMTRTEVAAAPNRREIHDLKCGPDGRIYFGHIKEDEGGTSLHVINNPDLSGLACQPQMDVITLLPGTLLQLGFPNELAFAPAKDTLVRRLQVTACSGMQEVWLQADTPGQRYIWADGISGSRKSVSESGRYYVGYLQGCVYRVDTFIAHFPLLPRVVADSLLCSGSTGSISFIAADTTAYTYRWYDAQGNLLASRESNRGDNMPGLAAGRYMVQISNASGCDTLIPVELTATPTSVLSVSPQDTVIAYGDRIQLQASGAVSYAWYPEAGLDNPRISDPEATPADPVIYTVWGTDVYGCTDSLQVRIHINYHMPVFIPSAFSPNGDGVNDVFRLRNISYQELKAFQVYNRWGEEVFSTVNILDGWDGHYKGVSSPVGTYYYHVRIGLPDGQTEEYVGDVSLIR